MKFIDTAVIKVTAGKGGDGCVAYRREKYMPRGGPSGGNGGNGGSVWFVAAKGATTLQDFRYRRKYGAEAGRPGSGSNRTGAAGEDLEIPVPCGTTVYDVATGEVLGDLVEPGDRVLAAAGGRGGKGNYEFRNPRNQTPDYAQPGRPGGSVEVRLELRLLADIGLVGLPNAGKSTLLARLTSARPKIADYPFTTLVPNLGIVDLGDFVSCTLADIPGLIEGASQGKGLGHDFLRHIERTRAVLMLVDVTDPEPAATLEVLHAELRDHGRRLEELPLAVALTKGDLVDAAAADEALDRVREWADDRKAEILVVSSVTGLNLDPLRHLIRRLYRSVAPEAD